MRGQTYGCPPLHMLLVRDERSSLFCKSLEKLQDILVGLTRNFFADCSCLLYLAFDETPPVVDLVRICNGFTARNRLSKPFDLLCLMARTDTGDQNNDHDNGSDDPDKEDLRKNCIGQKSILFNWFYKKYNMGNG